MYRGVQSHSNKAEKIGAIKNLKITQLFWLLFYKTRVSS